MLRSIILLSFLLPVSCFGQFIVSGKVLNKADARPVPDASVFLSNATIGNKTANDGTFMAHVVAD